VHASTRFAAAERGRAHQSAALLVGVELNRLVQGVDVVGGAPVLGVLELLVRLLDDPSPSAEEAPA